MVGSDAFATYSYQPIRMAREASAVRAAGVAARIVPVRARPQIGGSFGSAATSGRTVKPCPRRWGTTTSSALQMVGVSHCRSASRSSRVNGCSAMRRSLFLKGP